MGAGVGLKKPNLWTTNAHRSYLRYSVILGDLEEQVVVPWKMKFNQVDQFSVHDNSLKYNHLADVELNVESDILQM